MTCVLLTRWFPPPFMGGSGVYLYNICSRFPPGEMAVFTEVSRAAENGADLQSVAYIRRSYIRPGEPRRFAKLAKLRMAVQWTLELLVVCARRRPDCIYVGQAYSAGLPALLARRLLGVPYVVFTYGEELTTRGIRTSLVMSAVCRHAYKVLTISEFTVTELKKLGVSPESITMARPGVDTDRFSPSVDARALREKLKIRNRKVILTVSRLTRRKGHAQVLAALPHVLRRVPDLQYIIVGSDVECGPSLRMTVSELNLDDHVLFTGPVDAADLPRYYALCDVFVMANYEVEENRDTEGFGIVFLEASACGKPVVGGRAGGAVEAIRDGVTGLLVDSLDTLGLAQSMTRLLTDDALARRLGAQGREWVMQNFGWAKTAGVVREVGLSAAAASRSAPESHA